MRGCDGAAPLSITPTLHLTHGARAAASRERPRPHAEGHAAARCCFVSVAVRVKSGVSAVRNVSVCVPLQRSRHAGAQMLAGWVHACKTRKAYHQAPSRSLKASQGNPARRDLPLYFSLCLQSLHTLLMPGFLPSSPSLSLSLCSPH